MENKTQKAVENITSILNGFTAAEIQEILFLVNEKCNANYVLVLEKKVQLEDSDIRRSRFFYNTKKKHPLYPGKV